MPMTCPISPDSSATGRSATGPRPTSETDGGRSVTSVVRERRILEPAALRRIVLGHALLLLRSAPPIMMTLTPWTDRADADQLVAARGRFETAVGDPGRRAV